MYHACTSMVTLTAVVFCMAVSAAASDIVPSPCARELLHMDADGSGSVDASEFATAQRMAAVILQLDWDTCDRNDNGLVSAHEFDTAVQDAAEGANARAAPSLSVATLLDDLQSDARYEAEIAALRAELQDFDDDDQVIAHIVTNTTRYPYLSVVARTWPRYRPVKPLPSARVRDNHRLREHRTNGEFKPPKAHGPAKGTGPRKVAPGNAGPKPAGHQGAGRRRG